MSLATCPECQRHVRTTERSCPFCDAALPEDMPARVQHRPVNRNRFGRAALVSFSAVVATSAAACASDDEDTGRQEEPQGNAGDGGSAGAAGGTTGKGGASSGETGGASSTGGGKATGGTSNAGGYAGQVSQPVYGIPVDEPDANFGQPEYGVPIDFDASAPDASNPVDAGGASNSTGGSNAVPVYGIPIDPVEP